MNKLPLAVIAGVVLLLSSFGGLIDTARRFDRDNEIAHLGAANDAQWSGRPDDTYEMALQRHVLPSPGVLSVSVCPEPLMDPAATLVTLDAAGHQLGAEKLKADEGRGKRCFEASQKIDRATTATAFLRVPSLAARRSIKRVTVQASRRITPRAMWPVGAMLAGFILLAVGPRPSESEEESPERLPAKSPSPGPFPPPKDPAMEGFIVGGVVPPEMLRPGEVPQGFETGASAPAAREYLDSMWSGVPTVEAATKPLVDSPLAWLWSLGAYVGVHIAVIVVAGAYIIAAGQKVAETGAFIAGTTLVQHGLLALAAVALMGGLGAKDVRKAIGIVPLSMTEVLAAIGIAGALVGIAIGSTHFIKDAGSSPMGEMIEIVPVRYVIAYGALLAPLSEELFFRGVLVRAFSRWGATAGILGSAAMFTLAHVMQLSGAWLGLVPIAAVGLVNAYLRTRSGGISQPWLVHALYNAALSAGLYFGG